MRLLIQRPRKPVESATAFTLPEMMITLSIFSLLVIAGLYSHLLGLKMNTFMEAKLKATHKARAALNQTRDEVRSAQAVYVGWGGRSGFTNIADGSNQVGNALQIYPTAATNTYVRYFTDTTNLTRLEVAGGRTNLQIIASDVTNRLAFHMEDYAGNILTNAQNDRVVCMTFEIFQFEFAVLQPGKRDFYDYYRLQTKVSRRALP
jgi:prepilin-type N-terminal cleavage/methylation domain-containing protein